MIVYDLDTFLGLPNELLVKVTTLYLPNNDLQGVFDNDPDFPEFTKRLHGATSLAHVNLRNNGLSSVTLAKIAQQLRERPDNVQPIATLNIYDNPGVSSEIFTEFKGTKTKIIAAGSSALPKAIQLPEEWELHDRYCEAEILEMLAAAEQMHADNPTIVKFHGQLRPKSAKSNQKLNATTDKQTNMPFSAVIMENGTAILIPKYSRIPDKVKNKKVAYPLLNYKSSDNKRKSKRMRIVFMREQDLLEHAWGQIVLSSTANAFAEQNEAIFLSNQPVLFRSRAAGYSGIAHTSPINEFTGEFERVSASAMYKLYSVFKYRGKEDALDYLNRIESDRFVFTNCHKQLMLAILLEGSCWHNNGALHLDIKLENVGIRNNDPCTATFVDLDGSRPMVAGDKIAPKAHIGSPTHLAPEVNWHADFYSPTFDYFACGITLCTIFKPEIFVDPRWALPLELAFADIGEKLASEPGKPTILALMRGLTATNPELRFSMQHVFMELSKLFPDHAQATITVKHQHLLNQLQQECTLYPEATEIIRPVLDRLRTGDDMTANLNAIFKLQLISYYMNLFGLAGDAPADAKLFQNGIEELMRQPNKPVTECKERYYYCKDVEEAITKLHNASGEQKHKRTKYAFKTG